MKCLQLAFILTGQERSANCSHLEHMRINLSGQGKMKSKNYPLCLQPSRRTEAHISQDLPFNCSKHQQPSIKNKGEKKDKNNRQFLLKYRQRKKHGEIRGIKPVTYMTLTKQGYQVKSDLEEKSVELPSILLQRILKYLVKSSRLHSSFMG